MNVSTATTAELLAFFNANTGGAQVKKFADRKTAERRVQALIAEMIEDGDAEGYDLSGTTASVEQPVIGEFTHCPNCGIHLDNGVGHHLQEVNGKSIKHDQFEYECLGCGKEFGPAIAKPTPRAKPTSAGARSAMVESLKLDRRIVDLTSGMVYKNACQVWKANVVSSSQCDRLSALLYGAAKNGDRELVASVNGHNFTLEVK